jgi:hypothetical protein
MTFKLGRRGQDRNPRAMPVMAELLPTQDTMELDGFTYDVFRRREAGHLYTYYIVRNLGDEHQVQRVYAEPS